MRFHSLDEWLLWQESLNPAEIDLGLARVDKVLNQLGLNSQFNCPLITVAGTNGKGSVVAVLEAIALQAGISVCTYTSPHINCYNERIRINGRAVDDQSLCEAFERVDQARADVPLTYFEFGTLAAIDCIFRQQADLVILEVGLGGRLDAVNVMDADVAILTTVDIDHTDWLGDSREQIGFEKAGVFRQGRPVVCGDTNPPQSVLERVSELHCPLYILGRDFKPVEVDDSWCLESTIADIAQLPRPLLRGLFQLGNASVAITAMQLLFDGKVDRGIDVSGCARRAMPCLQLAGRFQQLMQSPDVYVDVAHNVQAGRSLASMLIKDAQNYSATWAIVAMLKDKDCGEVLNILSDEVDHWCFAGLENVARGQAATEFAASLPNEITAIGSHLPNNQFVHDLKLNQCTMLPDQSQEGGQRWLANTVAEACHRVLELAKATDRIIIFGSFYTVSEAMQFFNKGGTQVIVQPAGHEDPEQES